MNSDQTPSIAQGFAQDKDNILTRQNNLRKSPKEKNIEFVKIDRSANNSTSKTTIPNEIKARIVDQTMCKYKIDINEIIPPPQIAWSLKNTSSQLFAILGTLGNFSLIIGKAKAKKSFFISMAVAVALTKNLLQGRLKSELPKKQDEVLYFDTEQSKYHVQKAVKRICELIHVPNPPNLHAYHLRSLNPSERLQYIEDIIYSNDKVGFVVIDGIKDLVNSINDESEATMIASKLLKWSQERNIHITTVLHQNKGDNNARGHIGTELINKAETVLSVTVLSSDKEISIVEPQQCRNEEPDSFAFKVDTNGIPQIQSSYKIKSIKTTDLMSATYLNDNQKQQLFNEVFSGKMELKYSELVQRMRSAHATQFGQIGENKIKSLLTSYKESGLLIQLKKAGPYTLSKSQDKLI